MHISTSISTAEWAAAASAAKEHGAVRRLSNMLQALQDGGGGRTSWYLHVYRMLDLYSCVLQ